MYLKVVFTLLFLAIAHIEAHKSFYKELCNNKTQPDCTDAMRKCKGNKHSFKERGKFGNSAEQTDGGRFDASVEQTTTEGSTFNYTAADITRMFNGCISQAGVNSSFSITEADCENEHSGKRSFFGGIRGGKGRERSGSGQEGQRGFQNSGGSGKSKFHKPCFKTVMKRLENITDTAMATRVRCCFGQQMNKIDSNNLIIVDNFKNQTYEKFDNSTDPSVITAYQSSLDFCRTNTTDCDFGKFKFCLMDTCINNVMNSTTTTTPSRGR